MKLTKISLLSVISLVCLFLLVATITSQAQSRVGYSVQLASATSEEEATTLIAELKIKGVDAYWVKSEVPGKGTRFRVRVGKFNSMPNAKTAGDQLIASGAAQEFAVMVYESPANSQAARREHKKAKELPALIPEPPKALPETAAHVVESPVADSKEQNVIKKITATPSRGMAQRAIAAAAKLEFPPVETPLESAENKEVQKAELALNAAPKTEPETKPTEIKPEETKPVELKTDSAPPTSDADAPADKADPKPLASPVANALADVLLPKSNWQTVRRAIETDKNLRAIHFVDSMTGWAAGDAGAIYRTTDGGRSWKPLLSGASANINFLFFLDWNHGWMIGDSTNKDDDGDTVLLNTTNGGRTWTVQKMPNLLSVHFTDSQNGWAVGRNATLLRTSNGGIDWKPAEEIKDLIGLPVESSNYNFGFRDVHFLDQDHGWLVGNFYGRAQNNIGGLFTTTDGGKTWKRIPLTLETKYVSGRFTPGTINSVRFTDEATGTVTGEVKDGESRYFFALHTRDGGQTWEQNRASIRSTLRAQFLDPVNGWMAAFAPREGSAEAVVYDTSLMRTDNGGQSWQTDFTAKGSRIRNLFFLSPNKGWAVGDRGMILRYEEKTKAMN
ncbi:MAG: YCF48-related protein [Blastocatellia bacterium]